MCPEIPVLAHKFHSNFWHLIGPYSYMWPKYRPMIGSLTTQSFPKCTGQSFQIRGERIYSFHFSVLIWETENSPTLEENDHCWIFWSNLLKLVRSFRNKKGGLPINCQAQVPGQVHARSGPGYSSNLILMGLTLKGDDLFPILVYIRELQRRMGTDPGRCIQIRLSSLMSRWCPQSPCCQ